jgi:DNA-binding transcriptional LysR family regulator
MTLKQLQAFYWAAKLGSFSIAADRLSISQSSLSKRIAELESNLGKVLFERSARRATLTIEGELALAHTRQMLDIESALRQQLDTAGLIQGTLRMGIGELSAATWFPKFMQRAALSHPDLNIQPLVSQARSMEAQVERGTLDCAVIAGHTSRQTLASDKLCSVGFAWMASPQMGIKTRMLTPETLYQYPVIAPAEPSGQAQAFSDWLTSNSMRVERLINCNSVHAAVELCVAGVGITVLPRHHLQPVLKRKLLFILKSTPEFPPLAYCFVWRRDDTRPFLPQVRQLVMEEVNFDLTTPLWQTG